MRNISEMSIIQIDITNACNKRCSNCTRFCGHYTNDKIYYMDMEYFEKALDSLRDYPGIVGIIGGEPTLHPNFQYMCRILQKKRPNKKRCGLWSNITSNFFKYRDLIEDTFGYYNLNDQVSHAIQHTPLLVASKDIIPDPIQRQKYIDNCWIQLYWSASITPNGAYFCEVAGMLCHLFNGKKGWDITREKDWWRKDTKDYTEQIAWCCDKCGCCLPLRPRLSHEEIDDISPSNAQRLNAVNSPKYNQGKCSIYTHGLDKNQKRHTAWYWGTDYAVGCDIAFNIVREKYLHTKSEEMGFTPLLEFPFVYGVLMDICINKKTVSLLAYMDKSARLYSSENDMFVVKYDTLEIQQACYRFITTVNKLYLKIKKTKNIIERHNQDIIRFNLLTFQGLQQIEYVQELIEKPNHQFFELYRDGMVIVSEIFNAESLHCV